MAERNEWKEAREHTPKAVVRIFLFQSRSPEMLRDDADPTKVEFVDTILLRKSGDNNPNQLMPTGGKIDDGETMESAIRRELVEETHLRAVPSSVVAFIATQSYNFQHRSEKHGGNISRKQRWAYFYQGKLLPKPHDVPYALDQAEDKIANFEHLSLEQCRELLAAGHITTSHGKGDILDSLDPDPELRRRQKVETDQDSITAVHRELLVRFQLSEVQKKLSVLQQLLDHEIQQQQGHEVEQYVQLAQQYSAQRLDFSDDVVVENVSHFIQEVTELWQQSVSYYHWTMADVKRGLDYSNMVETLENAPEKFDAATGKGIPTVSLIFPLLLEGKFDRQKYRILEENPETAKLLKMTAMLHRYNKFVKADRPEGMAVDLRKRLGATPDSDIDVDTIRQWIYREGMLSQEFQDDFFALSPQIDGYFQKLNDEAHITEFSIDQANQVKGASLETLLELVFSGDDKLLRWEAERKLTLLYMLHEASTIRKRVQKRGVEPLDKLEAGLEVPGSGPGHRVLRLAGVDHPVKIERRTKTLMSLLRKLIVRDRIGESEDIVGDINAESYIFTDLATDDTETTFTSPCSVTNDKGEVLSEFTAPKVVGDLITEIVQQAWLKGERVDILKYKAPPKPGETFSSSGPGGGGNVHLAKFYIKHTDTKGVVRLREAQVFFPRTVNDVRRSGEGDYEIKKADDSNYAVRRLFSTPGLRSFMELLYPAEIYGDSIQPIYSAKVKKSGT